MKKTIFLFLINALNLIYAQGYVCAVGGGSEDYKSWSDKPYGWIVQKADSGKIIIITDTPASDTAWLPNYFRSLGAKVVLSMNIGSKTIADDQATYDELITANGIFIRGGDQWQYWYLWSGTKTAEAIKKIFQNGGVIAGTSAGAMVLSEFVYTGTETNTVDSKDVLLNPSHPVIQLQENFLDLVPNTLIDTHFIERGRFGRLIIFMYNLFTKNLKNILGIGIDDQTALCINPAGVATVYGNGAVSFFNIDNRTRISSQGKGYTVENLKCDQLVEDWQYDLNSRSVHFIPPSAKHVDINRSTEFALTDLWLTGNDNFSQITLNCLPQFLLKYNPADITILCGAGSEAMVSSLGDYLDTKAVKHKLLVVSSSNTNDLIETEKINSSDALMFLGNDLSSLTLLNDQNSAVGEAFSKKISSGIPILALGNRFARILLIISILKPTLPTEVE
jgi:cyanophycinase